MPHLPNGNHGTLKAFRGRAARERRLALNPPTGQKEGEVGGKLSAGWSPLRALQPHNESADVSPPLTPARVAARDCAHPGHFVRRCARRPDAQSGPG